MDKITSFTINHLKLLPGVYVSRKDKVGNETVTTFDVRFKRPNIEPCMDIAAIHTLEHLMAVCLREDKEWADSIIYVGPMGCRTGMYIIFKGDLEPEDVLEPIANAVKYVINFEGKIPATTSKECGNYLDHNLAFAKWECEKFYNEVLKNIKKENMVYPD